MVISSVTLNVYALPPSKGYSSSADCTTKSSGGKVFQTCCYRKSSGVSLGETYCQTCTLGSDSISSACGQEELQFKTTSGNTGSSNNNEGIFEEPDESNQGTGAQAPLEGGAFSKQSWQRIIVTHYFLSVLDTNSILG